MIHHAKLHSFHEGVRFGTCLALWNILMLVEPQKLFL